VLINGVYGRANYNKDGYATFSAEFDEDINIEKIASLNVWQIKFII